MNTLIFKKKKKNIIRQSGAKSHDGHD